MEQQNAEDHDSDGDQSRQTNGIHDPLAVPCTIIVCDDRNHTIVDPEDRHENKTLQLKIDTEYSSSRRIEDQKDFVKAKYHDRADGLHDDGRNADSIDFADDLFVWPEFLHVDTDLFVDADVEKGAQSSADDLSDHGRDGGSCHLQPRKAEQSEDQDRIQDDIDNGAGSLGDHSVKSFAGCLEKSFHGNLYVNADGADGDDFHILDPILDDRFLRRLRNEKQPGAKDPDKSGEQKADDCKKNAVFRRKVGLFKLFFAQAAGKEGIDADTGTDAYGDHQILDRKSKRYGGQCVLA